jgi:hypothetical protein
MRTFDQQPAFFSEEESRKMASRQVLPFLALSDTPRNLINDERVEKLTPSKALFSLDQFTEEAFSEVTPFFRWKTRPIYDISGLHLFYDHTLPLRDGNELRVRTAASDLLLTPVWSIRAGRAINVDGLISKAVSVIRATPDLEPVLVDDEVTARLICYAYPKMGVACFSRTRPTLKFIMDLWALNLIPIVDTERLDARAELVTALWSPYDLVTTATVGHLRARFRSNIDKAKDLPELPERVDDLRTALAIAGRKIQDTQTVKPELKLAGQQTSFFCAVATAKMILDHHQIFKTQDDIALEMRTVPDGTEPVDQAGAFLRLSNSKFSGELDSEATFEEAVREIQANRPFRTGGTSHARACGGYVIETSGKEWVYIYDPEPLNIGDVYYEAWEAALHTNYIYVTPVKNL